MYYNEVFSPNNIIFYIYCFVLLLNCFISNKSVLTCCLFSENLRFSGLVYFEEAYHTIMLQKLKLSLSVK